MALQPLGNRVVVKVLEPEEETTAGGIVIPESAQDQPQQAEVIAVGPGKHQDGELVEPEVDEGDTVVFGKYSGSEIEYDGQEYLILNSDDILAIVT
ncbi:MAG: co-chaperone GroES [bacterium]